jgi:hypothetical protein
MNLRIMHLSPLSFYLISVGLHIVLNTSFSDLLNVCSSPGTNDQVSFSNTATSKVMGLCILNNKGFRTRW